VSVCIVETFKMPKRWTKDEESNMLESIRTNHTLSDYCATSSRSKNAILTRAMKIMQPHILKHADSSWLDADITIMYGLMPTETSMRKFFPLNWLPCAYSNP